MVESNLRQSLIDVYYRCLFLNVEPTYENYKYTFENEKLVLLGFVDINKVKEAIINKHSFYIDPYFEICRLSDDLGRIDGYIDCTIKLGDSFEIIEKFNLNYKLKEEYVYKFNCITLTANSVIEIGNNAFSSLRLPTIFYGENVKQICLSAFEYNKSIVSVYVPKCESFWHSSFKDAYNLKTVKSNAIYIGKFAFFDCYNLSSIQLDKDVQIHSKAYNNSGSSEDLLKRIATYTTSVRRSV